MLTNFLTLVLLLSGITCFSQSRKEAATQLSSILNNSYQTTDISYFKNTCSPDCNAISYSYTLYEEIARDKLALFATITDSYENISWNNLDYITRRGETYLVFNSPITQTRKVIYGNDFKNSHQDNVSNRQVNSIGVFLFSKDRILFEKACLALKRIDAGQVLPAPAAPVTSLPVVAYCQKKNPPTKREVEVLFIYLYNRAKCKESIDLPGCECYLSNLAGVNMTSIHSDKDLEKQYPVIRDYWNHYSYSFSIEKSVGSSSGETTFLETGNDISNDDALDFIGYELHADINAINPFTGKNYFDNVAADFAKAQHGVESIGQSDAEHTEKGVRELKNSISNLNDAKRLGGKPSDYILYTYKYDTTAHAALIEAITCNAQGEGIFAGLQDNPLLFLKYMYNVGVRNFSEAVFLFENIYHVKISEAVKAQSKSSVGGIKAAWY